MAPERRGNQQGRRALHEAVCRKPCMKLNIAVKNPPRFLSMLGNHKGFRHFKQHLFCGDHSSPLYTHFITSGGGLPHSAYAHHLSFGGDHSSPHFLLIPLRATS
jgi:hypothetical protein